MEALTGLGADVTTEMIQGLLSARAPRLLDEGSEEYGQLIECVRGAATEVVPLVGDNPPAGHHRSLAVRAIAYCAAAELESALFPEQQGLGDLGRANFLLARYEKLRAQLVALPSDDTATETLSPVGSFPPAQGCYPDPAERRWPAGDYPRW